jgi:hypothetical protein
VRRRGGRRWGYSATFDELLAQCDGACVADTVGYFFDWHGRGFEEFLGVVEAEVVACQEWGVVPVAAVNRRAKVRGLISARAARVSTVSGWRKLSRAHLMTAVSRASSPSVGTGQLTYCAWPPARCGATTTSRAIAFATAGLCSRRCWWLD